MKSANNIAQQSSKSQKNEQQSIKQVQFQNSQRKNEVFYGNILHQEMGENVVLADSVYLDQSIDLEKALRKEKQMKLVVKELYKRVKILQEEKESLKEDIEFLLLNFGYIFELGKKNIAEGLNRKFVDIQSGKNIIIKEHRQLQKKYVSAQNQRKMQEAELEQVKIQLREMHEQYSKAKEENMLLKKKNLYLQETLQQWEQKQIEVSTNYGGRSLKELYERDERISGRKGEFKVKKTKTEELKDYKIDDGCDEKLKSLGKLKFKINRLKSQLAFGVKLQ